MNCDICREILIQKQNITVPQKNIRLYLNALCKLQHRGYSHATAKEQHLRKRCVYHIRIIPIAHGTCNIQCVTGLRFRQRLRTCTYYTVDHTQFTSVCLTNAYGPGKQMGLVIQINVNELSGLCFRSDIRSFQT